jgi:tetratricopeptide (TPR) repeat protein
LYEKGRAYFQIGEYQKALEAFKAAHVEKADPAFLYNIAECHRQLGDSANALAFYQRFLRLAPPDNSLRAEAEARIAELQARKPPAPPGPQATPATGAPATPGPVSPIAAAPQAPPATGAHPTPPDGSSSVPTVTLAQTRPAESGEARPVYRRGWFWVAVAVVLLGGAVAVWAVTRSGGGTDIPMTTLGNDSIFGASP